MNKFKVHREFLEDHYNYHFLQKDMYVEEYNAYIVSFNKQYVTMKKG